MSITMDNEQFDVFTRALTNLVDGFNDVDIREGIVRSRSTDRTITAEIDLTPILGETTLPLLLLKQKMDLLKCFRDSQEIKLSFNDNGDWFSFSDDLTELTFRYITNSEYIDNKFMTEQELQNTIGINEDDLLLSTSIDETVSNRIKTISSVFNVDSLQVNFNDEEANISLKGTEQSAMFYRSIPVEQPMNAKANVIITPFVIDHDGEVAFKMYKVSGQKQNISINKSETTIGDVNITIYSRSGLVQSE